LPPFATLDQCGLAQELSTSCRAAQAYARASPAERKKRQIEISELPGLYREALQASDLGRTARNRGQDQAVCDRDGIPWPGEDDNFKRRPARHADLEAHQSAYGRRAGLERRFNAQGYARPAKGEFRRATAGTLESGSEDR